MTSMITEMVCVLSKVLFYSVHGFIGVSTLSFPKITCFRCDHFVHCVENVNVYCPMCCSLEYKEGILYFYFVHGFIGVSTLSFSKLKHCFRSDHFDGVRSVKNVNVYRPMLCS